MPRRIRLSDTVVGRLKPEPAEYTVWDTRVAGLGVRVRPSGGQSFVYLEPSAGGKPARRHTLGGTSTLSVDEARRASLDLQTRGMSATTREASGGRSTPRFREFVESEWIPAYLARYRPFNRKAVTWILRARLTPAFGARRLDGIGRRDILRWFDSYSATAPGAANYGLKLLRNIFRHAIRRGHLSSDPTRSVRPNPRPKLTRFLSVHEIRHLHRTIDACVAERPSRRQQADVLRLLLLTGCRRSEILNLRREEIQGDILRLRESKTGPKTVYLCAEARRILARQPPTESAYVFPSPMNPDRPLSPNLPLWYRVRRLAGLDGVRLHDLRHTFASQAVLQGVPVPVVARLLGHQNVSMTFRYTHVADRDIEAAAERVGLRIASHLRARPQHLR